MRLSKFSDVYLEIGLLMSYQLAEKRVRPKVFYYAYAPSTHSNTTSTLDAAAQVPRRVEEFFGLPKLNGVLASLVMQFLAPSKNLQRGPRTPAPPCQHATAPSPSYVGQRVHLVHFLLRLLLILNRKILYTQTLRFRCFLRYFT